MLRLLPLCGRKTKRFYFQHDAGMTQAAVPRGTTVDVEDLFINRAHNEAIARHPVGFLWIANGMGEED